MKTVTIYDYIKSELEIKGQINFISSKDGSLNLDKNSFIRRIINYDDQVKEIVNYDIFNNEKLANPLHDDEFKKGFVNRFLNRSIDFQSFEVFASKITTIFLTNKTILNSSYENFDKYLTNFTGEENTEISIDNSSTRNIYSTLPQGEINIDLNDDNLKYADENTIGKNKKDTNTNTNKQTNNFNFSDFKDIELTNIAEKVYKQMEKCFLNVYS